MGDQGSVPWPTEQWRTTPNSWEGHTVARSTYSPLEPAGTEAHGNGAPQTDAINGIAYPRWSHNIWATPEYGGIAKAGTAGGDTGLDAIEARAPTKIQPPAIVDEEPEVVYAPTQCGWVQEARERHGAEDPYASQSADTTEPVTPQGTPRT